jgi:peptide/nickel transport system permease protein
LILKFLKQPQFLIGLFFITALLFVSFSLSSFTDAPKEIKFLYKDGQMIKVAPLSPSDAPPFGTDKMGKNLLYEIIGGAKYTLLIAFGVAFFRISIATLLSFSQKVRNKQKVSFFNDLVQSTIYIPTSILAYMFMAPLFMKNAIEPMGFIKILMIQVIILTLIGTPPLIGTFSSDIQSIMNKEYVVSTLSLGAKKTYVYRKHVFLEMRSKMILLFAQQTIQTLILLAHLGVLSIFIGGAETVFLGDILSLSESQIPISGEWSGIIGHSFQDLMTAPWIILIPIAFFSFSILAINLMIQGIQNVLAVQKP